MGIPLVPKNSLGSRAGKLSDLQNKAAEAQEGTSNKFLGSTCFLNHATEKQDRQWSQRKAKSNFNKTVFIHFTWTCACGHNGSCSSAPTQWFLMIRAQLMEWPAAQGLSWPSIRALEGQPKNVFESFLEDVLEWLLTM